MSTIALESVLTCPRCGFSQQETMPTDACLFFYECRNCHTLLRPKHGDCCVLFLWLGEMSSDTGAERVLRVAADALQRCVDGS